MTYDILIVDDEADIRTQLQGILEDQSYQVRLAKNADEALAQLAARRPSLAILDIWLHGSHMDGLAILNHISTEYPGLPVIMISGHGTVDAAVKAMRRGAFDFIEKPFQLDVILNTVSQALELKRLRQENEELRLKIGTPTEIVGKSTLIETVRNLIHKAAPTNSRVLITGQAGTGKELVARKLHLQSKRGHGPFVVVNCATLHPARYEADLFGVEGKPIKIGLFEQAHGGTLFLDKVGDMPLESQSRLVRLLQDQSFCRVGGRTTITVDVRIIASSNRDLKVDIAEGRFREDLYYRLSVVPIHMPSLADRRDDIPELAQYFMQRVAEAANLPPRPFADDATAAMQTYYWPGNVRQLRNIAEWLLIMAAANQGQPVRAEHLPAEITEQLSPILKSDISAELLSLPLREARELFERDYLLAQVNRFGGNISRTASFVGMERSALHRKLKLLGVNTHNDDKTPEAAPKIAAAS